MQHLWLLWRCCGRSTVNRPTRSNSHSENAENRNLNSQILRVSVSRHLHALGAGKDFSPSQTPRLVIITCLRLFTFQSSYCWADASGNILLIPHTRVMRCVIATDLPAHGGASTLKRGRTGLRHSWGQLPVKTLQMRIFASWIINLFSSVWSSSSIQFNLKKCMISKEKFTVLRSITEANVPVYSLTVFATFHNSNSACKHKAH